MKRFLCGLALLPCAAAMAAFFPIDVTPQLNGVDVSYETTSLTFNSGVMALTNRGSNAAACKAVFNIGPDTPRVRKVTLAPGKSATLTGNFKSQIIRMRIELTCNPA
ncbi:3-phosphoglycerate kinase [Pseudomonas sp. UL073]|uniref:3-phosphoglycerate kinase n=1 Tax=Zestomonas insulae TaxID=2809017 RepID=A0ABS2IC34_9GAMM|nr:3-phosphoglycerate kinase [Pseudomonas insulae]MBM7060627.1 3-phosphoglycerate kinase [Pseudomonas insulae]